MCGNCQKSNFIQSDKIKEEVFGILQMLRIHTGLQKRNKNNVYDIQLREINPIGIDKPCIKIAYSELLFENIEWLLSGTKMQLKFRRMMQ